MPKKHPAPKAQPSPLRKWTRSFISALVLVIIFLGIVVWRTARPVSLENFLRTTSAKKYNVLLITIDTLRADRLGVYGFKEISTPNIDELAKSGVLFTNATAHVPLTLPSHTSILTGNFPSYHGVHDNGGFRVGKTHLTAAEIFKQNGFSTAAFVGAFVLDSTWGLNQGFDTYYDKFDLSKEERVGLAAVQRPAEEVLGHATKWLDQHRDERFFVWTHFYDPHTPYEPPEAYQKLYPGRPYIGEIAYTDSVVGKLLHYLEQHQLLENTIILLTGDHGESLGEHRESTHAFFIYDATMHVPMILSAPEDELNGKRITQQARSVDIMPTLLQMAGVSVPESIQGRSLLHLILQSSKMDSPPSYGECYYPQYHFGWSRLLSLRDGRYKYIDSPRPELYDIQNDPKEITNLYEQKKSIAERMKAELRKIEGFKAQTAAMQPGEVDDETHEKLAALGYVGAFGGRTDPDSTQLPDPKDKIELFNLLTSARMDSLDGNSSEAISKLHSAVQQDPGIVDAHFMLGNEYYKNERYAEALEAFKKALQLKPDYEFALINMANTYRKMGKIDEAIAGFEYFLKKNPENTQVLARIGELHLTQMRPDQALSYFRRALKANPETSWVYNSIGMAHLQKKEYAEAEKAFEKAIQLNSKINMAHFNLAQIYESKGNTKAAEQEYLAELEVSPKNYKAAFNLGRLYVNQGKTSESIDYLKSAVENAPDFGLGYLFLAQAHVEAGSDLETAKQLVQTGLSKELDPEYRPLGHYVLADIYNRLGRYDLEREQLSLAKQNSREND